MKTLEQVRDAMGDLYDQLLEGKIDLRQASEQANIAGKFMKAEQLILAREIFMEHRRRGLPPPQFPAEDSGKDRLPAIEGARQ